MYKALLIDFDGTIANTLPLVIQAYTIALAAVGRSLSQEDIIKRCFSKTEEVICAELGIVAVDTFKETYLTNVHALAATAELFPGVRDVLQLAQQAGKKMGVITYGYRSGIDRSLKRLDLTSFFQTVVSYDDVTQAKPHPEAVYTACEQLRVPIETALVIGDSHKDILMAKNAGIASVLFYPDEYKSIYDLTELKTYQPEYIISDWNALLHII